MSNKKNISVDETVLIRYLAGEATPDEAMAVDEWLEADAANHEAFWQLSRVWEQQGTPYHAPDAVREWERFAAKHQAPKVRRMQVKWWLAAAVTLACLLLAYRFWPAGAHNNEVRLLSEHAILRDTLPDQSVVVIRPGSELLYARAFDKREVTLKGEGYFDIKPDAHRPFIVEVGELRIRVLGTAFNIISTTELIIVQVNSGAVQVSYQQGDSVISAGRQFTYNRAEQHIVVNEVTQEQTNNYAYATQQLHFHEASLGDVVRQLEKAYNVSISLQNAGTAACKLSTDFNGESITYVLDVITASLGLSYTIQGNHVNISGNGCE